jgi:hypothetical protein
MMLINLGFRGPFVNWVMSCVSLVSFSILISSSTLYFFRHGRDLRHDCPLSPLLFLVVAKGLSKTLLEAKRSFSFKGIKIGVSLYLSHMLCVGDILIFVMVQEEMLRN